MKLSELEALVKSLEGRCEVLEGKVQSDRVPALADAVAACEARCTMIQETLNGVLKWVDERGSPHIESVVAQISSMGKELADLGVLVRGRNSSAALQRNMTDEDAKSVLNGENASLDHKAAAAKLGLTYAQVYSCRGEFTFKHVHKELRDSGWKNPWSKDKGAAVTVHRT